MKKKLILIGSVSIAIVVILVLARTYYIAESNKQFNYEADLLKDELQVVNETIKTHQDLKLIDESEVTSAHHFLTDYKLAIEKKKIGDAREQLTLYQQEITRAIDNHINEKFGENAILLDSLLQQDLTGYNTSEYNDAIALRTNGQTLVAGLKTKDNLLILQKNITDLSSLYATASQRIADAAQATIDQNERILQLENSNLWLRQQEAIRNQSR